MLAEVLPIHAHLAILRPMSTLFRIALTALILAGLSACGAKGPLVLPEKAEPVEVPAEDAEADVEANTDAEATPEATEEQAEDTVETPPVIPAGK